jgi:hypothetical protein
VEENIWIKTNSRKREEGLSGGKLCPGQRKDFGILEDN